MTFWLWTALILVIAAGFMVWPLLFDQKPMRGLAMGVTVVFLAASYFLYQGVGTPDAIDMETVAPVQQDMTNQQNSSAGGQIDANMETLAEGLRQRLNENPDDVEGWVLLARSYKTLEMYPQAIEALETAKRLTPESPFIDVELVEARLFNSNDPRLSPEMISQLENAVATDPTLQKALWLLGIAAAQDSDDENAIKWWEALRQQLEPGSQIEQTITAQLSEARARLGLEAESLSPVQTGQNLEVFVSIDLSEDARVAWPDLAEGEVPDGYVLFLIARPLGQVAGPPLGVRRIEQPVFPVGLTLSDKDSMLPQRPISSAERIEIQARLSASGQPMAAAGDWQSPSEAVEPESAQVTQVLIDHIVD